MAQYGRMDRRRINEFEDGLIKSIQLEQHGKKRLKKKMEPQGSVRPHEKV